MSTILEALRKIQQEERRRQEEGPEPGAEAAHEEPASRQTGAGEESPLSRLVEKASPAGEQRRTRDVSWVEGARSAEALAERLREADRAVYGEIDESMWEGGEEQAPAGDQTSPASTRAEAEPAGGGGLEEEQLASFQDERAPAAAAPPSSSAYGEEPAELPAFEPTGGAPPAPTGNRRTLLLGGVAALLVAVLVYARWPSSDESTVALAPKGSAPAKPVAAGDRAGKAKGAGQGASKRSGDVKHPKAGPRHAGQAGRHKAATGAAAPAPKPGAGAQAPQAAPARSSVKPAAQPPAAPAPVSAPGDAAASEVAGAKSPSSAAPAKLGPTARAGGAAQAAPTAATAAVADGAAPVRSPTPAIAPAKPQPPFPGSVLAKTETGEAGEPATGSVARPTPPKAEEAKTESTEAEALAPSEEAAAAAGEQPEAEPKPTVLLTPPAGAPEVRVVFVQWARAAQKRMVSLRNPSGTLLVLREGDFADPGQGLLVSSIGREWVDFTWKNSTYRVFLNEH